MLTDVTTDDLLKLAVLIATLAGIYVLGWRLDCRTKRRHEARMAHEKKEAERAATINRKARELRAWMDAHDGNQRGNEPLGFGPGTRPKPNLSGLNIPRDPMRCYGEGAHVIPPAEMGDETRRSAAGIGDTPTHANANTHHARGAK